MSAFEIYTALAPIILTIIFGIWNYMLNKKINKSKYVPHAEHENTRYIDFDNKMEKEEIERHEGLLSLEDTDADLRKILEKEFLDKEYYKSRGDLYNREKLNEFLLGKDEFSNKHNGIWISYDPQQRNQNIFELFVRHKPNKDKCKWELYPAISVIKLKNDSDISISKILIHKLIKYKEKEKEILVNVLDLGYTIPISPKDYFYIVIREIYDVQNPNKLICTAPIYKKIKFHITLKGRGKEYDYNAKYTLENQHSELHLGRIRTFMKIKRKIKEFFHKKSR